jgi:hypothetical protein
MTVINKVVERIKERELKIKSFIVFGSAVRGGFKPGVSDVDALLIVERFEDLKGEIFEDIGGGLELGILTVGQFLELYYGGDPLAHMVWLEGQAIYDDGFYENLKSKGRPGVTELTLMKLRHWGLQDLAEALRGRGGLNARLRSLHHAVRNFARFRVARDKGVFKITDEELLGYLDEALSTKYREFLNKLASGGITWEELLTDALNLLEQLYGGPLPNANNLFSRASKGLSEGKR